jgi:hypothetical protein
MRSFVNVISETKVQGALPGSGIDMLSTAFVPARTYARLYYQFTPTIDGILSVTFSESTGRPHNQYGGGPITAGAMVPGEFRVPSGNSVNFQFSGSSTGFGDLFLWEL